MELLGQPVQLCLTVKSANVRKEIMENVHSTCTLLCSHLLLHAASVHIRVSQDCLVVPTARVKKNAPQTLWEARGHRVPREGGGDRGGGEHVPAGGPTKVRKSCHRFDSTNIFACFVRACGKSFSGSFPSVSSCQSLITIPLPYLCLPKSFLAICTQEAHLITQPARIV